MYAASPNIVSFAASTTSSSSSNAMIGATGPKISVPRSFASAGILGQNSRLEKIARTRRPCATNKHCRAAINGVVNQFCDFVARAPVDQGARYLPLAPGQAQFSTSPLPQRTLLRTRRGFVDERRFDWRQCRTHRHCETWPSSRLRRRCRYRRLRERSQVRFPPSSIEQVTTRSLAFASRTLPTSVEPVKDTSFTRSSSSIEFATAADRSEGMTLTTPAGKPASISKAPMANAVNGVSDAGFKMVVQPAATAGPIFRVAIAAGKFHGVISRHTPIGCWSTKMLFLTGGTTPKVSPNSAGLPPRTSGRTQPHSRLPPVLLLASFPPQAR